MRKRNWSCPEHAKAYQWPEVSVSTAPAGGASSHAAPSAHAIEYDLLAGHPVSGGESSSPPAAVIDELQAEVQKLKGEAAELRAELDELKVRDRQRDEEFEKLKQDIVWLMEEIIAPRPPRVDITDSKEECPRCGASRCQERFRACRICRERVCEDCLTLSGMCYVCQQACDERQQGW